MKPSTFPNGMKFDNFAAIKDAVDEAYSKALDDARDANPYGCLYSRGRHLLAARGDQNVLGEAESWPWDGTKIGLIRAINEARFEARADRFYISGGINWATSPRHYADQDYEPWVADWSVLVWERSE